MHTSIDYDSLGNFLGSYYLVLAAMNAVAAFHLWHHRKQTVPAVFWMGVGLFYVAVLSPLALSGDPSLMPGMPAGFINVVNTYIGGPHAAVIYGVGSLLLCTGLLLLRRFFVKWWVAWSLWNAALVGFGLSMTNMHFHRIAAKPDNVPIIAMVFLIGFFTWLATAKAVANDDRKKQGLPPAEKEDDEKILVWPDLVYTELICMILLTALMLVWSLGLQAPLEEQASSVKTPNPSKAPWYFLGLQEMLVYFDPWMAGVVLPSLIIVGLMAIPYIDFNQNGNGYYTIEERPFAYSMYQFGFLVLWVTLIILGTFLRGPNWNFFSPYEEWDKHKVVELNNVDLSEYFWEGMMRMDPPKASADVSFGLKLWTILKREWLGIGLVLAYFILLPPIMAATVFRDKFVQMGFMRYMVMANLLLFMALLPIKMVLRWTFNLKYIIHIEEFFLNL